MKKRLFSMLCAAAVAGLTVLPVSAEQTNGAADSEPVSAPPVIQDSWSYDPDSDGLKDIFGQYFRVGGAITKNYLKTDAAKDCVKKHFNSVSCQFGMAPLNTVKAMDGTNVTVDISCLAPILDFAEQNDIPVRGTNYFSMPTDLDAVSDDVFLHTNAQECNARIESLLKNTFSEVFIQHPNLKLYSFDVCTHVTYSNSEAGFYMPGVNTSSDIYGGDSDESIIQAFKSARKYAPRATKLYLCNEQTRDMTEDADIEAIVKKIMQEGDYIDGVSLKAVIDSNTDLTACGSWLKKLSALGMDIQFADIRVRDVADYTGASSIRAWKQFFAMAADYAGEISCVTLSRPTVFMLNFDEGPTTLFNGNSETGEITLVRGFTEIADMMKDRNNNQVGDANCDGVVDVSDAVLIARFAAEDREATITDQGRQNADVTHDGNVDAQDATKILQYIAKKISYVELAEGRYAFKAVYTRTQGISGDSGQQPLVRQFSSRDELDAYIAENKEALQASSIGDETRISFPDAASKYTSAWFDEHKLLIVCLTEDSGSVRHEVTGVSEGTVSISRSHTTFGTGDMAYWHILIELDQSAKISDDIQVLTVAADPLK